jgi:hypothetical protein
VSTDELSHGKVDSDQGRMGSESSAAPGGERGGILDGLFGAASQEGGDQGSGLGDLLAKVLDPGGDLGDLLQTFLGAGADQILPSIAGQLTSNLDLSSETAQTTVSFVLGKLFASQQDRAVDERQDLSGLLGQMGSEQTSDESSLRSTGWAEELAARTGLDVNTALEALQAVVVMLGGRELGPAKKKRKSAKKKTTSKSKPKTTSAKKKTTSKSKPETTSAKKKTASKSKSKTTSAKEKTTSKSKRTSKKSES